ncbi:MAG: tRNA epoxyqueuosine(34) reductase QueG, partial [Mariprofundaceae bacterium]|nr:tRNA epoxyqueuosine(34) reductase QueG [Mariprofundaceae bacterium]
KKRLKQLAKALDSLFGSHEQRVYVDTAPVLEHALAESSGLGWQGKHSLTLNRQHGSWFFLGEIFTTAFIEADDSATAHCGSCTACIDICPTKAIVAPFVVDARLCISYLTIEYKGLIPRELRPLMGNRIYGCDDCQMVCPWNRDAQAPDADLLEPRGENILPELAMLLQLDEAGFRERFRKSPVRRTGKAAIQRNVCTAMGNSGDNGFVPLLMTALKHEAPVVRAHAAWALARIAAADECADDRTHKALLQATDAEQDQQALDDMRLTLEEKE